MNIFFWDTTCNKSYDCDMETREALGGTERTVLRVAQALINKGHDVSLYQHTNDSTEEYTCHGIRHVGLETLFPVPDVIVHLRTAAMVDMLSNAFPNAKHIVWMHDLATEHQYASEYELFEKVSSVIAVSQFHANNINTMFKQVNKQVLVNVIYNPVTTSYVEPVKERFARSAVFLSSPHKGLKQTLNVFKAAKEQGILDTLEVANPGYVTLDMVKQDGVYVLGEQSHASVMSSLAKAGVLLYPQNVFPETFGLVFAEANALGVPVLAYDMGAAKEVLSATNPPYRERSIDGWLKRLREVMQINVEPKIKDEFKLENVAAQWDNLLERICQE